jgi:hypothetical protein
MQSTSRHTRGHYTNHHKSCANVPTRIEGLFQLDQMPTTRHLVDDNLDPLCYEPKVRASSTTRRVVLFLSQCLRRIDPRDSQGGDDCGQQRHQHQSEHHGNQGWHIVDAYAVKHVAHHSQRPCTKDQSQKNPQRGSARSGAADLHHRPANGRA